MEICALIITYNPDFNILKRNVTSVKLQISQCLIVDNGSNNQDQLKHFAAENKVELILLGENRGIAAAQNVGFKEAKKNDVEWVLTLDQDSVIPDGMVQKYTESKKMEASDTGIVTGLYFDRKWNANQRAALIGKTNQKFTEKDMVISSGNLVRVKAWEKVLGFDEYLFIDMVDYDFDAKLRLFGYRIWQINSVLMEHEVGRVIHKPILEHILLLPESGLLADHPAFRQYYIYRNSIIFQKRFPRFANKRFLILRSFFATRRMFVYRHSVSKFLSAWRGIIDGYRYQIIKDKNFTKFIDSLKNQ